MTEYFDFFINTDPFLVLIRVFNNKCQQGRMGGQTGDSSIYDLSGEPWGLFLMWIGGWIWGFIYSNNPQVCDVNTNILLHLTEPEPPWPRKVTIKCVWYL